MGTELVVTEENGKLLQEEWPKGSTLIVCDGRFVHVYGPGRSLEQGTHNSDTEEIQDSAIVAPPMTIFLDHHVRCHASIGRTAVTGGSDATVRVWDIITGECQQVLIGHRSDGKK